MVQFGKFTSNLTSSTLSATPVAPNGPSGMPTTLRQESRSNYWLYRPKDAPPQSEQPAAPVLDGVAARESSTIQEQPSPDLPPVPVARKPTLLEALRDGTLLPPPSRREPPDPNRALRKRHKAIQRQLRLMFIYPLVYLLMWIAPFINHCYYYTKQENPPFIVNCIALISLCLQCAVDCLVFSIRETPWRYTAEGHDDSRRTQSIETVSAVGMRNMVARNGGADPADMPPERNGVRSFRAQSAPQPRIERNWWDGESI